MNMLLAVDGSDCSNRAVDYLIKLVKSYREAVEVHLLNVQPPLPGTAGSFVSRDVIEKYHQEEAMKELRSAMAKLDAAGVKYHRHIGVGDPADTIAGYAREKGCDQILMGTRGMGSVSNLVLGSVATKVIHLSPVPVVLIK
jgi:nucleotide-binding universal stress UspA family protein